MPVARVQIPYGVQRKYKPGIAKAVPGSVVLSWRSRFLCMTSGRTDLYSALLRGAIVGDEPVECAQQMLQVLMDSLASAVFWKDTDSRYLGCNQAFADYAGVPVADLVGLSDDDMPWAGHGAGYTDWDRKVFSTGQSFFNIDEELLTVDGVERRIETNKVPLLDPSGQVIGLLGSIHDVTERRAAENELQSTLRDLDERVIARTAELAQSNASLRREVKKRVGLQMQERRLREHADLRRDLIAGLATATTLETVVGRLTVGLREMFACDLVAIVLCGDDGILLPSDIVADPTYEVLQNSLSRQQLAELVPQASEGSSRRGRFIDPPAFSFGSAASGLTAEMRAAGATIGFVSLESRVPGFFDREVADQFRQVVQHASAVASNIRMTNLAAQLAAEAEREKMTRGLHDSVIQSLAAAALNVEASLGHLTATDPGRAAAERALDMIWASHSEVRALMDNSQGSIGHKLNLAQVIEEFQLRPNVAIGQLKLVTEIEPLDVSSEVLECLCFIGREALVNADRHAEASEVRLTVTAGSETVLVIEDNGKGFDPQQVSAGHLGLRIMAARSEELGLDLHIDAAVGRGTKVTVRTP